MPRCVRVVTHDCRALSWKIGDAGTGTSAARRHTRRHFDLSVSVAGSCALANGIFVQLPSATSVSSMPVASVRNVAPKAVGARPHRQRDQQPDDARSARRPACSDQPSAGTHGVAHGRLNQAKHPVGVQLGRNREGGAQSEYREEHEDQRQRQRVRCAACRGRRLPRNDERWNELQHANGDRQSQIGGELDRVTAAPHQAGHAEHEDGYARPARVPTSARSIAPAWPGRSRARACAPPARGGPSSGRRQADEDDQCR